jgi:hypothetical protein
MGRDDQALGGAKRSLLELQIKKSGGIDGAGQDQALVWNAMKPDTGVVGFIANQENEPMAIVFGKSKTVPHEGKANAQILPVGVDGERAEQ